MAARKVSGLLEASARVTVIAPCAADEISHNPNITWLKRRYESGDARNYRLIITATQDPEVNAAVARDAGAANVFVNSADDPANCTFTLPAVARQGDITVAVSTGGRSPAMARWLRQRFEREIDPAHGELLELVSDARVRLKSERGTSEVAGWGSALSERLVELVRSGQTQAARQLLADCLGLTTHKALAS